MRCVMRIAYAEASLDAVMRAMDELVQLVRISPRGDGVDGAFPPHDVRTVALHCLDGVFTHACTRASRAWE